MTAHARQQLSQNGVVPTYDATDNVAGDTAPVGNLTFLHFKNPTAGAITATIVTPGTEHGLAIADLPVVVGANSEAMVSLGNATDFVNHTDNLVHITYSAAGLTLAVLNL